MALALSAALYDCGMKNREMAGWLEAVLRRCPDEALDVLMAVAKKDVCPCHPSFTAFQDALAATLSEED